MQIVAGCVIESAFSLTWQVGQAADKGEKGGVARVLESKSRTLEVLPCLNPWRFLFNFTAQFHKKKPLVITYEHNSKRTKKRIGEWCKS